MMRMSEEEKDGWDKDTCAASRERKMTGVCERDAILLAVSVSLCVFPDDCAKEDKERVMDGDEGGKGKGRMKQKKVAALFFKYSPMSDKKKTKNGGATRCLNLTRN